MELGVIRLNDGRVLKCDYCIIATGSETTVPDLFSWKNRYDAEKLLFSEKVPEEVQIAGGGVLGIELAVILKNFGCRVTLFEKEKHILPGWDRDVSISIRSHLQDQGIQIVENSDKTVFDDVVFCCGRKPVLPEMLTNDSRFVHVLGGAAGGTMTADKAREDGEMIGSILRNSSTAESVKVQTRCLFTPLEAAMTGELLQENCIEGYSGADMAAAGMIFSTQGAFAKAVMEKESHILTGFHIVSALASETIQTGALAVANQMTAEEFLRNTAPHPTEGEILREAVRRLL